MPHLTIATLVQRRIFIFILLIICRLYTASEAHVGIKIVQTLGINFLISIDPLSHQ